MRRFVSGRSTAIKAETLKLLENLHKLDKDSEAYRDIIAKIVDLNMGMVYRTIDNYTTNKTCYDKRQDLISAGVEGLISAIPKYDMKKGIAFSTFITMYIWGFIMKWMNVDSAVPVPAAQAAQAAAIRMNRIHICKDKKSENYGKVIFTDKKGNEGVCSVELTMLLKGVSSLETLRETSPEKVPEEIGGEFEESVLNSEAIRQAFATLPERDANILRMRYEKGLKLREVADKYKISTERIRQIEVKAKEKLKKALLEAGVTV